MYSEDYYLLTGTGIDLYNMKTQKATTCVSKKFLRARDMAVDENNNIYVVDELTSQVYKVPSDCSSVTEIMNGIIHPWLIGPTAIDVQTHDDTSVDLYIANLYPYQSALGQIYKIHIAADGKIGEITKMGDATATPTDVSYNTGKSELAAVFGNKFPAIWNKCTEQWDLAPPLDVAEIVDMRTLVGNINCCEDSDDASVGISSEEFREKPKSAVMIALGTGIGGSIYINGEIFTGTNNMAGELGYPI